MRPYANGMTMKTSPVGIPALLIALAGCGSGEPRQVVDIRSEPAGAMVYRVEGPAPGLPPTIAGAVTPAADAEIDARRPVGRTPLAYVAEGRAPYRLLVELEGHAPYEVAIPGAQVEAHVAVALVPTGALAEEDAALGAILAAGPTTREDLERAGRWAAVERLLAKGLVDKLRGKPEAYDLGERGVARLRQRMGEAAVIEKLAASRRTVFREGKR